MASLLSLACLGVFLAFSRCSHEAFGSYFIIPLYVVFGLRHISAEQSSAEAFAVNWYNKVVIVMSDIGGHVKKRGLVTL